jgi:uncharacterized protein
MPGPYMAVYYASKAFILSFSDALRVELAGDGIRVTTLCPGPVPTEFQARAGGVPNRAGVLVRSAREVALEGYRGLMAGKAVVIPGWANKIGTIFLHRLLPRTFVAKQIGKMQAR